MKIFLSRFIYAWGFPCPISSPKWKKLGDSTIRMGRLWFKGHVWSVGEVRFKLELPKHNRAFRIFKSSFLNGHKMETAFREHQWKCPYFNLSLSFSVCVCERERESPSESVYLCVSLCVLFYLSSLFFSLPPSRLPFHSFLCPLYHFTLFLKSEHNMAWRHTFLWSVVFSN